MNFFFELQCTTANIIMEISEWLMGREGKGSKREGRCGGVGIMAVKGLI